MHRPSIARPEDGGCRSGCRPGGRDGRSGAGTPRNAADPEGCAEHQDSPESIFPRGSVGWLLRKVKPLHRVLEPREGGARAARGTREVRVLRPHQLQAAQLSHAARAQHEWHGAVDDRSAGQEVLLLWPQAGARLLHVYRNVPRRRQCVRRDGRGQTRRAHGLAHLRDQAAERRRRRLHADADRRWQAGRHGLRLR